MVCDMYDIRRLVTWSLGLADFEPPHNYCRCFSIDIGIFINCNWVATRWQ